jgi:hypothetical protein
MKISILLPTNRNNNKIIDKIKSINKNISNREFNLKYTSNTFLPLIEDRTSHIDNYLEPTLRSLEKQRFKDFELVISHKNPTYSELEIVKSYNINTKLVKEKHSLWHDLDDKYPTLCNNINTAFIHSNGELLLRLDDLTIFGNKIIGEVWKNYKDGYYSTAPAWREIDYNQNKIGMHSNIQVGPNKWNIIDDGLTYQDVPVYRDNIKEIPVAACWGYFSSISRDEFMKLNGHNELFDGSIAGTDLELGQRLSHISKFKRKVTENRVFEINDIPYKHMTRDDTILRQICQREIKLKANTWKPSMNALRRYKKWHIKNHGSIDENWDKLLESPEFDLKEEYKKKRLGEVLYDYNNN